MTWSGLDSLVGSNAGQGSGMLAIDDLDVIIDSMYAHAAVCNFFASPATERKLRYWCDLRQELRKFNTRFVRPPRRLRKTAMRAIHKARSQGEQRIRRKLRRLEKAEVKALDHIEATLEVMEQTKYDAESFDLSELIGGMQ